MIHHKTFIKVTKKLLSSANKTGDASFCVTGGMDMFPKGLPILGEWHPLHQPSLLWLKIKGCVEPHRDPWYGSPDIPPEYRKGAFWFLSPQKAHLQSDNDYVDINQYDFDLKTAPNCVVFDTENVHSLITENTWCGLAWEVSTEKYKDYK